MEPEQEQGETPQEHSELDKLLEAAVARQEALRMPKAKPHWKQIAKRKLKRSRKHEQVATVKAYRQAYTQSLRGMFVRAKREQEKRGVGWELTYDQWLLMWTLCRPTRWGAAWRYRGRKKTDVQLYRVEKDKGFTLSNLEIWQGAERLYP